MRIDPTFATATCGGGRGTVANDGAASFLALAATNSFSHCCRHARQFVASVRRRGRTKVATVLRSSRVLRALRCSGCRMSVRRSEYERAESSDQLARDRVVRIDSCRAVPTKRSSGRLGRPVPSLLSLPFSRTHLLPHASMSMNTLARRTLLSAVHHPSPLSSTNLIYTRRSFATSTLLRSPTQTPVVLAEQPPTRSFQPHHRGASTAPLLTVGFPTKLTGRSSPPFLPRPCPLPFDVASTLDAFYRCRHRPHPGTFDACAQGRVEAQSATRGLGTLPPRLPTRRPREGPGRPL